MYLFMDGHVHTGSLDGHICTGSLNSHVHTSSLDAHACTGSLVGLYVHWMVLVHVYLFITYALLEKCSWKTFVLYKYGFYLSI